MLEYQKKRKVRRVLYSKLSLCIFAVVLLFLLKAVWGVYVKENDSSFNLSQTERQLASLEDRQSRLVAKIADLKTERGVEAEIRDKFGVAKPGEKLVVVLEDKATTTDTGADSPSWWSKFLNLF